MIEAFDALWDQTRQAFAQERTWRRARTLALGSLVSLGRRTVAGMLAATGQQQADWSAAYRLFERERFDAEALLAPARRAVVEGLAPGEPLVAAMDDTLMKKRGRKVAGAGWRRDPLGPPFAANLVWAQRFIQLSAMVPESDGSSRARAIPIDLVHCPSPRKPSKRASPEQLAQYRLERRRTKLTRCGADRLAALRAGLDADGQRDRALIVSADGAYTNTAVIKTLPERTALVGRLRKDAKLYAPPGAEPAGRRGPKRIYGTALPTLDQLRRDDAIAWQTVEVFAAGRLFDFQVKTVGPVRWRGAGARDLRLVVIRPLGYRPSKGARLRYRNAAYLICTDPHLSLRQIVQSYVWRWEIEVNFRDEKTLLGVGQAQVRTAAAVERVPLLIVAAYAFMHLALMRAQERRRADGARPPLEADLPRPRWNRPKARSKTRPRCSTAHALNLFRFQLWGRAIGVDNYSDFMARSPRKTKSDHFLNHPANALFYASG